MSIGSWLAGKLSDPDFEAWLDERIRVATKAAVAEALERLDEQQLALAVADRVVDKVGGKMVEVVRGELVEVVAAFDGRIDEVLGSIGRVFDQFGQIPRMVLDQSQPIAAALLGGLVGAGKAAGVGNVTLGSLLDNLLDGRLPFAAPPPLPPGGQQ